MLLICRIQGEWRLFEVVGPAIFLVEILYEPDDSKNDKPQGNHERDPYRNGW